MSRGEEHWILSPLGKLYEANDEFGLEVLHQMGCFEGKAKEQGTSSHDSEPLKNEGLGTSYKHKDWCSHQEEIGNHVELYEIIEADFCGSSIENFAISPKDMHIAKYTQGKVLTLDTMKDLDSMLADGAKKEESPISDIIAYAVEDGTRTVDTMYELATIDSRNLDQSAENRFEEAVPVEILVLEDCESIISEKKKKRRRSFNSDMIVKKKKRKNSSRSDGVYVHQNGTDLQFLINERVQESSPSNDVECVKNSMQEIQVDYEVQENCDTFTQKPQNNLSNCSLESENTDLKKKCRRKKKSKRFTEDKLLLESKAKTETVEQSPLEAIIGKLSEGEMVGSSALEPYEMLENYSIEEIQMILLEGEIRKRQSNSPKGKKHIRSLNG